MIWSREVTHEAISSKIIPNIKPLIVLFLMVILFKARNLPILVSKLGLLIRSPDKLKAMSERAKAISYPFAAKTVVDKVVTL
jgi:hypothetical protein